MLGVPTPNEADPTGEWYAFEKGAAKAGGGEGFADVWKRGHFAWEYKGKRKDLVAAYQQLLQYREALENPPYLVVCDLDRFEVHTNFTGTKAAVHAFTLDDLRTSPAEPLRILRAVFQNPDALRPTQTREQVTEEAATRFAELAEKLQKGGREPQAVAHFLNRLLFCFFAEDIGVLPRGLVNRLLGATRKTPEKFTAQLGQLFGLMSKGKGYFGTDEIEWFNGGLFDNAEVVPLAAEDLETLLVAARLDWSSIEPAILGTLFERGLEMLVRLPELPTNVVVTDRRADHVTADGHALDQLVRVITQDIAILERARLALVGIAHDVFLSRRVARHERPLQARRETRAATAAQR